MVPAHFQFSTDISSHFILILFCTMLTVKLCFYKNVPSLEGKEVINCSLEKFNLKMSKQTDFWFHPTLLLSVYPKNINDGTDSYFGRAPHAGGILNVLTTSLRLAPRAVLTGGVALNERSRKGFQQSCDGSALTGKSCKVRSP